jgi:hypothetical protein
MRLDSGNGTVFAESMFRKTRLTRTLASLQLEDLDMTRLTLVLAGWIGFISAASGSLTPHMESPLVPRKALPALAKGIPLVQVVKPLTRIPHQTRGEKPQAEFGVTSETEILLNGKPCSYDEIPSHASIVQMDVAADKKTVLKIHFRTQK